MEHQRSMERQRSLERNQLGMDCSQASNMLESVARQVGRPVRIFVRPAAISTSRPGRPQSFTDESDDFYQYTAEDYARHLACKKEDLCLKTKKIRDQELSARRARFITVLWSTFVGTPVYKLLKATVRVQFPDSYILEATFPSNDSLLALVELIRKVIPQPNTPFYLYTTPPKQRIKNLQQDMHDAGLAPTGHVYFAYDQQTKGVPIKEGPSLRPEVQQLRDLHLLVAQARRLSLNQPHEEPPDSASAKRRESTGKSKPKWLKM